MALLCHVVFYIQPLALWLQQGDHLSGKPASVREFDSCQGNVRDFTKNQGNVRGIILSGKSCLKLFIVCCIFASVQVFSTNTGVIWVTLNMLSAVEECCEPSGNCTLSGEWSPCYNSSQVTRKVIFTHCRSTFAILISNCEICSGVFFFTKLHIVSWLDFS